MNKEKQEKISFMVMFSNQWAVSLDLACRDKLEVTESERYKIDHLDWYAYMARRECLELDLDPELILKPALIKCADRWLPENTEKAAQ